MDEPDWAHVDYPKIDYQDLCYYAAPKSMEDGPKSLDEVDPQLLETYSKLGIPLQEQEVLAGFAKWRLMRCLTASRSARPSAKSWPKMA